MVRFRNNTALAVSALTALVLLAACSAAVKDAREEVDRTSRAAFAATADARQPLPGADVSLIKVRDNVFVGSKVRPIDYGDPLPRQFESDKGITIARARPMRLIEIASTVTQVTKIPVVIEPDQPTVGVGSAIPIGSGNPTGAAVGLPGTASSIGTAVPPNDIQAALNQLSGSQGGGVAAGNNYTFVDTSSALAMRVSYTGRLSSLLDLVSSHFNVAWRHIDGRIVLSRTITRTFDLPALGATQDLEFNLRGGSSSAASSGSSGGSSGGGGGGAQAQLDQKASIKGTFDPWKSIDNTVKQIVGTAGRYDVSSSTGTITVTATPSVVQRVSEYVETMRGMMSKQVALSVQVLNVSLNESDTINNNIGVLFRGTNVGAALGNSFTPGAGSVPPTDPLAGVIGNMAGTSPGLGWAILGGKLAGSSGIINALSQNGKVSVVTTASMTTVNGAPVPLQVVNRRGYLASITVQQAATTTATGTTGVFQQLTPGEVTTGFNLQVVPRILKDGNLVLQYGVNISELVGAQNGFDVFGANGNQIQLPNVNMRNFVQQSIVPNRATLVLAGYEQVRAVDNKAGIGTPDFFQLGGSRTASKTREVIVILITPTLLDVAGATDKARGADAPRVQEIKYKD